ncbi:uncharacterized protein LOC103972287 isoform X2 [Musa acuminata AAA Group]|uniref:uncharacterized protein LOC103972287 isoform X2 n=1 Tax=Musa acuminata AAA Group TaxID=214697 RepID=UPI0031E2E996
MIRTALKMSQPRKNTHLPVHHKNWCLDGQTIVFQEKTTFSVMPNKGEYCFQVELAGNILGKGVGLSKEEAKLQAAEEALLTLKNRLETTSKEMLKIIKEKPQSCIGDFDKILWTGDALSIPAHLESSMLLDLLKAPYPSPPFVVQVGHDAGKMLSEDEAHHHIYPSSLFLHFLSFDAPNQV